MKKKLAGIPFYYWFIVIGIALVGLILGTIFDYDITSHLAYQVTGYGEGLARFIEGVGQFLGYAMIPIGGTLVFSALLHDRPKWATAIGWIVLILALGISTYLYGKSMTLIDAYPNMKIYFSYPLAFFLMAVTAMVIFFLFGVRQKNDMLRAGIAILAAMIAHVIIVNVIKVVAQRPRFRYIYAEGGAFTPWYQWNGFVHGLSPDDCFQSFPSGHAACTSITLMMPMLCMAKSKQLCKHEAIIVFWICYAWTLFVSFCRILAGAHYLSDISMGMVIGMVCDFLAYFIAYHNYKEPEYVDVDGMRIRKVTD